ncbi:hypothetical protein AB733_21615 [Photobacterium swingsii]|uniref:XRE family transcriptional regulator n=1 Tax=Photobacterium swingsii TaxID=680026 RepID=A0A0J8XU01_9GAMM|nr:helix-turn-helix transcriptional regulator [Photobacterium swingsii]KMV28829.1 hypothetical protein AB733_21615 [Photobacterium swingsii]PSW24544.1 XRE family transcriptional regulator [Photobacterium swingsii]
MTMSILARNIETRKRDLGIPTSIKLAKDSGVSRAVLTNIKNNPDKSIMLDSAVRLAESLQCRLEWLATGKGSPTADEYIIASKIEHGAPLVTLNELVNANLSELTQTLLETNRERLPCPIGNSHNQIVIRVSEKLGKYYAGGYMWFDVTKTPVSGQVVLVKTESNVEVMEFQSAHGRQFLKSLNDELPMDLRLSEINDQTLIATFSAYAIF